MSTPNNAIPFVPENTIDPAAGLNDALLVIDSLLQLAVSGMNVNTPVVGAVDGARFIVGPAPTGQWAGHAGNVAVWTAVPGYWSYYGARYALSLTDGKLYVRTGSTWSATSGGGEEFTTAEKTKLAGVAPGATANQTDAYLLARGNHTGTQAISTVVNLQNTLDAKLATALLGAASGVASLGADGKIPTSQLPPLAVNEVFTVGSQAAMLALTAERGDIAIRSDLGGASFVLAADAPGTLANWITLAQALSLALNALNSLTPAADRLAYFDSASTAQLAVFTAQARTLLAATTTAAQRTALALGNVDNTADSLKPVSTAQQAALDAKVSVAGDQFVTGLKIFTSTLVVQNGAGAGSLKLGADVNSSTLTDNIRKLARVVVPPRNAALPNWTMLAGDTTDNAGANEVYFGGAPGSSIGGATSLHFYTAPDQSAGTGVARWRVLTDGHFMPGAAGTYDIGSAATPVRSLYTAGNSEFGGSLTLTAASSKLEVRGSGMEFGRVDGSGSAGYIDFHSGVTTTDYDARLLASGGSGASGGGNLTVSSAALLVSGILAAQGSATIAGPLRLGQYTLTTLPSAATYSGYTIDVTNATGGPKQCRSNGTNWLITNTSTIVN